MRKLFALLIPFVLLADPLLIKVDQIEGFEAKLTVSDQNSSKVLAVFDATVGKNSVAKQNSKKEGDGKTPSGSYKIRAFFGKEFQNTALPFITTSPTLHCVDDPTSIHYNQIVDSRLVTNDYSSFEEMLIDEYELGAVISYNEDHIPSAGSCIFLHIGKPKSPTAGCVATTKEDFLTLFELIRHSKDIAVVIDE